MLLGAADAQASEGLSFGFIAVALRSADPATLAHSIDQAVEYERPVYKIHHHLVETLCYLAETIELVTKLASRVDRDLFNLTHISNHYIRAIDAFMKGHQSCAKGDCYKAA